MTAAELRDLLQHHAQQRADVVELPMVQPLGAGGRVRLQAPGGGTVVASSGAPFAPGARLPVARVQGGERMVALQRTTPAGEGTSSAPPLVRRGSLLGLRGPASAAGAGSSWDGPVLQSQTPDPAPFVRPDPNDFVATLHGSGFFEGMEVQPIAPLPDVYTFSVQVVDESSLVVQFDRTYDEYYQGDSEENPSKFIYYPYELHLQVVPIDEPFVGGSWAERVAYVASRPDALIVRFAYAEIPFA